MSIFDWFSGKKNAQKNAASESSGLGPVDVTLPLMPNDRLRAKLASASAEPAANRKTQRMERRELLYSVVRDTMIRAGILAASYKFKVLSLDARGHQYLIMMDLASSAAVDLSRLAEIEVVLAQAAKMQHDILVTAVYWRVNEHVSVGLSSVPLAAAAQAQAPAPAEPASRVPASSVTPAQVPVPAAASGPHYEPLHEDELAAFKRARSEATPVTPPGTPGTAVTSGRRNPAPPEEFADTQIEDPDQPASSLSITQYGNLN